jgi:hypothetical protein
VHLIRSDEQLPIDWLFLKSNKQMQAAIEAGRAYARSYLIEKSHLKLAERPTTGNGMHLKRNGRTVK